MPRYQETYGVDWSRLDPMLVAEIESYLDCLARTDPFRQDGPARPLRPASLKAVRGSLQRYLGALEKTGVDITRLRSLEQLVDFELFKQAIGWLWRRNGQKISRGLEGIAWTVRCIAIKRCKVDEETTAKYVDVMRTLRVEQQGLSDKNDALLQRFDDRDLVRRFLDVPAQLWADAERRDDLGPHKVALLVQVAIAIEILQFAPMRASNLVQLDLERHFNWLQDGREQVLHITIPAEEVKNRQRLHSYLPADASRRIRVYLERWRPLLVKGPNRFLFPGRGGGCKDQSCLSRQVTRAISKHAGVRVTPHQLRHIAAKLLLDHCPRAYESVRRLLGHKRTSTTYEHYCGRETKAAAEHYNMIVLGLRSPTAPQGQAGRSTMQGKRTHRWRPGRRVA